MPAAQTAKEPAPQTRAQRGGLSSMMAAIGGTGAPAPAPSFASAVAASQGANPPGFLAGGRAGGEQPRSKLLGCDRGGENALCG